MEQTERNLIMQQMKDDYANGKVKIIKEALAEFYVATDDPNKRVAKTGTLDTILANYKAVFMTTNKAASINTDNRLTILVGPPDTGKTTKAINYCKDNNLPYILVIGRDELTFESILQDFTLENGAPVYKDSLVLQYLTGTNDCRIIIDEFNCIRTGVLKSLQPLLDTTSDTFEFKGKIYNKNPNCKFICTLNNKDKGISILPNAILSRARLQYMGEVDTNTIINWTGYKPEFVESVYNLFDYLEATYLFGTRQVNIIKNLTNVSDLNAHIKGLLVMINSSKGKEAADTPEVNELVKEILNNG